MLIEDIEEFIMVNKMIKYNKHNNLTGILYLKRLNSKNRIIKQLVR